MVQSISPAVQKDFRDDLLVANSPSFLSSDSDILPVLSVGQGIARNNARQAVKTYTVLKAAAATTYTQIATTAANTRLFFLGYVLSGEVESDQVLYIEDASTGNITPSDNSTVGLVYAVGNAGLSGAVPPLAREVKRGIRLVLTKSGTDSTVVIVYYLEERVDGQLENL